MGPAIDNDAVLRIAAFSHVPWFLPGVVISVMLGYATRQRVAAWLGVSQMLAWAAVVSLGIIVFATLTPLNESAFHGAARTLGCDFSRVGLASPSELLEFDDTGLNILLFIPLGAVIGLIPRSRRMAGLLGAAVALPFVIETTQLLATPLDRACQSADVVDNLTGLVIGFALGWIIATLRPVSPRADTPRPSG
jgi:glycopeptide antibiotics resistance protein